MAPDGPTSHTQFLVDPRRAVEAMVLLDHRLNFICGLGVLHLPLYRRCLLPVHLTAAGHSQPASQPGNGVLMSELIDQAKPLGVSCSLTTRAAASLKVLFPPQFAVFTARLNQFSAFLPGQWAMTGFTELTTIDTGLTDPLGRAAHWNSKALGHSSAGQPLSQVGGNRFLLLQRCKPPACTVWGAN